MNSWLEKMYEVFDHTPVIDTHSHVMPSNELYDHRQDFLVNFLQQYLQDDIRSAGMTKEEFGYVMDENQDIVKRFAALQPYWKRTMNTGYARLAKTTLQLIYGESDLTDDNIMKISAAYRSHMEDPDFFEHILCQVCHIRKIISDHSHYDGIEIPHDEKIFLPVYRMDYLIMPENASDIRRIERECGFPVNSLDDLENAARLIMKKARENGAIGYKSGLAYNRSLFYEFADYNEARKGFEAIRRARISLPDNGEYALFTTKAFQDYMMHVILSEANKEGAVFQFHTGIQVGQGNIIPNSNPELLTNIFIEYQNIKFDIFHGGYPYFYQLGALAKQFPNVYADLCWMHTISPNDTRTALSSWLDTVPVCKILGFGDDVHGVEAVAGQLYCAKDNICRVLAAQAETGLRDMEECEYILHRILLDNPAQLYNIRL